MTQVKKTIPWVWLAWLAIMISLFVAAWQATNNKPPSQEEQLRGSLVVNDEQLAISEEQNNLDSGFRRNDNEDGRNDNEDGRNDSEISEDEIASAGTPDTPRNDNGKEFPNNVLLRVPFSSQAPDAQWDDDRFQDGCEEATVLMAMRWVQSKDLTKAEAKEEIIKMAAYQNDNFGHYHDTDAADTVSRLFSGYFNYAKVSVSYNPKISDIIAALQTGQLVLVPTDGRLLGNPYYTQPGPSTHMLVIKGYDAQTKEFITNDPGTKRGQDYRYPTIVVWEAMMDYPTGRHELIVNPRKAMIIVNN